MKPPERIVDRLRSSAGSSAGARANGLPSSGSTWFSVIRARYASAGTQARATAG